MDTLAFLLMILVFVASLAIQGGLQATFARYSRVANSRGLTGAEVARAILDAHGLTHVRVEPVPGALTDHYDPQAKAVRLSEPNYASPSLAALAVAAHEVGHAVQDARGYAWLRVRASLLPAASLGSNLGPILVLAGLFLGALGLAKLGLPEQPAGVLRPAAEIAEEPVEQRLRGRLADAEAVGGPQDRPLRCVRRIRHMGAEALEAGDFGRQVMHHPVPPGREGAALP